MILSLLIRIEQLLERTAEAALAPFLLATRVYVAWVFLKSGYLKLMDWQSTLALFEYEYRVPILSPTIAAHAGTAAEIALPVLLLIGLFGRSSAIGLFATNAVAVLSYAHVLLGEGFEAAVGQHYLWGYLLLVLIVAGPGAWSADTWLAHVRNGPGANGVAPARS